MYRVLHHAPLVLHWLIYALLVYHLTIWWPQIQHALGSALMDNLLTVKVLRVVHAVLLVKHAHHFKFVLLAGPIIICLMHHHQLPIVYQNALLVHL